MVELTYLAEVLRKRQALEREERVVIERRNRELEEIKWKQQIMDVETELGVTRARLEVMHEFEEESGGKASFDGRSHSDIEKWVMSNPSIPAQIKTNIHDDGDASMFTGHDEGTQHSKVAAVQDADPPGAGAGQQSADKGHQDQHQGNVKPQASHQTMEHDHKHVQEYDSQCMDGAAGGEIMKQHTKQMSGQGRHMEQSHDALSSHYHETIAQSDSTQQQPVSEHAHPSNKGPSKLQCSDNETSSQQPEQQMLKTQPAPAPECMQWGPEIIDKDRMQSHSQQQQQLSYRHVQAAQEQQVHQQQQVDQLQVNLQLESDKQFQIHRLLVPQQQLQQQQVNRQNKSEQSPVHRLPAAQQHQPHQQYVGPCHEPEIQQFPVHRLPVSHVSSIISNN